MICDTNFISVRKSKCCSERCRQVLRSNKKLEKSDHIECPACHQKVKHITIKHVKSHGYESIDKFKQAHGLDKVTCQSVIESNSGENNPGYQHGGKYSKFSKNFMHGYDEQWHMEWAKNHSEFRNNNKELFKTNLEYWVSECGGDVEIAKKRYIKFQTRDLAWFVEKYGEQEGTKRHQQKIERWQNSLGNKPVEELMKINSKKVRKSSTFYSKAEKELYDILREKFPALTDQFTLPVDQCSYNKQAYLYDMKLGNKIIEYNGDFWHSNPKLFNEDFVCPYTKRSQQEIHQKDADKIRIAKKHGYELFVVWEHDYKQDKDRVIKECLQFLNK